MILRRLGNPATLGALVLIASAVPQSRTDLEEQVREAERAFACRVRRSLASGVRQGVRRGQVEILWHSSESRRATARRISCQERS